VVRVGELGRAAELLAAINASVRVRDDHLVLTGVADPAAITSTLGAGGLWLTELTPQRPDLEKVFLELTGAELTGAEPTPEGTS
jgi:ABC-2 type transport system ATP-binding protein